MPPKPASELTQIEVSLLVIAAKLLAVAARALAHPFSPTEQARCNAKVREELVSLLYRILHCTLC
jgi:hypothetical protein